MKFPLGQVVATPGALRVLEEKRVSPELLLKRHQNGDWGTIPEEDRTENEISLKQGFRVMSSYPIGIDERIWIITEADRSVTTILKPEEY